MKTYFSNHKHFFIVMLALGLLTFGASWLTDLNNQTSVESSELVNVFGRKEWATFWELYAPIISLLFIGAAGIIPLAFLFGSKLGTFSRRFVIFFSVWMVTEFVLLLLVIQPREIFEIEFRSVIYWLYSAFSVLPIVVGYIMIAVWFGYIIANTASAKGKSWDSFFWLTMIFSPFIMWIVVSLLTPEEDSAKGKVRMASQWKGSATKALFASPGSISKLLAVLAGLALFFVTLMNLFTPVSPDLFGMDYYNFVISFSAIWQWVLLLEFLAFTNLALGITELLAARKKRIDQTGVVSFIRKRWKRLTLVVVIFFVAVGIILSVISLINTALTDPTCAGPERQHACETLQKADEAVSQMQEGSMMTAKFKGTIQTLRTALEDGTNNLNVITAVDRELTLMLKQQ